VPADVAQARYEAVLEARDRVLHEAQTARIGSVVDVLVDEVHPDRKYVVGRPASDAPEVDLVALVEGSRAEVGDVVHAKIVRLDEAKNLVGREVA
jgi:tRNA A37 methylthiotransferase MiaB